VLVAGEETASRCGPVETVEEPGAKPPRHLHNQEDETLYVVEGSLSVWVAGRWIEAPVGTAVFLPRGLEHAFVAATERARVLSFFAPYGKIWRDTRYFAEPFETPEWRAQWVERMDP
jgi:quercetin dioxygenase-like cupin family protein